MKLKSLICFLALAGIASTVHAQTTFIWNGASTGTGSIFDLTNWSLGEAPSLSDLSGETQANITFGNATNHADVSIHRDTLVGLIDSDTLTLNDVTFTSGTASYSFSGTGSAAPTLRLTGNIQTTVANSHPVQFNSSLNLNLSGGSHTVDLITGSEFDVFSVISGEDVSITKTGGGTLVLSGANSSLYGSFTISGGTVKLGNSLALQNANVFLDSGSLNFSTLTSVTLGDLSGAQPLSLTNASSGAVTLNIGGNGSGSTFTGLISGTGSIVKDGDGDLTLSGNNTFSGGVMVNSGRLLLGSNTAVGTGTLTLAADSYIRPTDDETPITLGNTVHLTGNGFIHVDEDEESLNLTLTGIISGGGAIDWCTPGILTLSNSASTFAITGGDYNGWSLDMRAGTVLIGASSSAHLSGGNYVVDSGPAGTGILYFYNGTTLGVAPSTGAQTLHNAISIGSGGVVFLDTSNGNLSLLGIISGNSLLQKIGSGSLVLGGQSDFFGGSYVQNGSLLIGSSSVAHLSGSTYVVDHGPVGTGSIHLNDAATLGIAPSAGAQTLHNSIQIGSMVNSGGPVYIDTSNGTLTLLGSISDFYYAPVLNKIGTGTLVLGGTSYFHSGLKVSNGTLQLASSSFNGDGITGPVGTSGLKMMDGTTLGVAPSAGSLTLHNDIALDPTSATNVFFDTANGNLSLMGQVSGAARLTKIGTNTLTLSSASIYGGGTTITGGVLATGNLADGGNSSGIGNSSNAAANLVLDGGTLKYTGGTQSTDRLLTVGNGSGGIDASGTGALTLSSTGSIAVTGSSSRVLTLSGSNTATNTLNPVIGNGASGTTSLIKSGLGTWLLGGANTFSGTASLNAGTLILGNSLALQNSTVTLNGGALSFGSLTTTTFGELSGTQNLTLANNSSGAVALTVGGNNSSATYSGALSGGGSVLKTGTGTLTLSGTNSYSGGTTINAGTLIAASNTAFGTGTVTVNGGGISIASGITFNNVLSLSGLAVVLGGNGTFNTHITADSHVVVSPGNSVGLLTFSAGLTFSSGGAISFQIQDANGVSGAGYDLISVTGGTLDLSAASANTITFDVVSLDGLGNAGTLSNFNPNTSYQWKFAASPNANIVGFNANKFHLDTSGFVNTLSGGSFSFSQSVDQRSLNLNFTPVPEPSTWMLMGAGLLAFGIRLRRRQA